MKKFIAVLFMAFALVACQGCAGGNIEDTHQVPVTNILVSYHLQDKAIGYLADAFRNQNNFTDEHKAVLLTNQIIIMDAFKRVEEASSKGTLGYWDFKFNYKLIRDKWQEMEPILSIGTADLSEGDGHLFTYVQTDLNRLITDSNILIETAEDEITLQNYKEMGEKFSGIASAIAPLVVKGVALL